MLPTDAAVALDSAVTELVIVTEPDPCAREAPAPATVQAAEMAPAPAAFD